MKEAEQDVRLFVGISPSDDVRRSLVRMQDFLSRHGISGTYLTPENLHMTLTFIGAYPEPFTPHFTLARHADFSHGIPSAEIVPVPMIVDQMILFRSDRGKNGMVYTPIGAVNARY